jgi:asparagine synthase (glutamine-hydrolysing)
MNRRASWRYLALGYVVGDESILENVYRLPPGSYMHVKHGSSPRIVEYWTLAELWRERSSRQLSEQEALSGFEYLLKDAVQSRLVSDVPLGAFLSGGIDSSVVCSLIKPVLPQLKTINVGFAEDSYDESRYAGHVAENLGTCHSVTHLGHVSDRQLEEICQRLDEPFADTSIIPSYLMCQAAREQITVALSGDGADELLAGYPTSQADRLHGYLNRMPGIVVQVLQLLLKLVPDSRRKVNLLFKARQFLRAHGRDAGDAHAMWRMILPDGLSGLAGVDAVGDVLGVFRKHYMSGSGLNDLDRFLYVDYKTWLVDDILVKVDRASMNHGLEVRSPFLDHRLVEYCAGLPEDMKMRGMTGKWLLRRVAEKYVPRQIIQRRKRGFNAPVSEWLATCWCERAEDTFSSGNLKDLDLLPPGTGERLWREHASGRRDHGYLLFALLVLDTWRKHNRIPMGRG